MRGKGRCRPEWMIKRQERFYQEMKAKNKRGVKSEELVEEK